jgi:hypothetical protein
MLVVSRMRTADTLPARHVVRRFGELLRELSSRTAVRALVDSRVEERKLRVKQLKGRLEMEQQRLADEEADKDRAIDASMAAIGRQRWPAMGEMVPPLPPQRPLRDPRNLAPVNPQGNAPANASEQGKQ